MQTKLFCVTSVKITDKNSLSHWSISSLSEKNSLGAFVCSRRASLPTAEVWSVEFVLSSFLIRGVISVSDWGSSQAALWNEARKAKVWGQNGWKRGRGRVLGKCRKLAQWGVVLEKKWGTPEIKQFTHRAYIHVHSYTSEKLSQRIFGLVLR